MAGRWLLPVFLILILTMILPAGAHVPISADNNFNLNKALTIEKPIKSYAIYAHLHDAGDVGYYQLNMNSGDRLTLSLMTPGFDAPVPDMVVMSPGNPGKIDSLSQAGTIPAGYNAEYIKGQQPSRADYEPFSPAAIYEVASYSKNITTPGTYYVAIIGTADETQYSIAVGYLEEFSLQEWVLIPINVINTHLWEGQSIIAILAPFLAVLILGFILIVRRGTRLGIQYTLSFWLATIAGLCYLGGASITLVQMVRVLRVTGFSASTALTLIFALVPIVLGIWALRVARSPSPQSNKDRLSFGIIGLLGLVFWAGIIIGPLIFFLATLLPERYYHIPPNG
jgi:hypothetical protein